MCVIGHPPRYRPDYPKLARNYCELGTTNAKLFEVTPLTIGLWIADIPEFAEAVRFGRVRADGQVAESLHQRAIGYRQTVERVMHCRGKPVTVTCTIRRMSVPASPGWKTAARRTGAGGPGRETTSTSCWTGSRLRQRCSWHRWPDRHGVRGHAKSTAQRKLRELR